MTASEKTQPFLSHVLWERPKTKAHLRVQAYFLTALFLIGIVYWVGFFRSGNLLLTTHDWVKEDAYLNILRLAQVSHVIPWELSEPFLQGTTKFLANPEFVLTPDILLLRWISNSSFVIFHTTLFYSLGFLGSLLIAKKLNVRFVTFIFFWLVFNFNGYLTSHVAVGHFQWTGYFLLPFFFLVLFKLTEETQRAQSFHATFVLGMSLLLGALFLNGSIHIAIWCSIFLVIVLVLRWEMYLNILPSILIGFMLGFGRWLPAALWFPKKSSVLSGYPTFSSLLDALTSLRLPGFAGLEEAVGLVGWWEYDAYIGFAAFAIFSISLSVTLRRNKVPCQPYLLVVGLFFLFLSLGNVYNVVTLLPLPFVSVERLPSRFIVMPFVLFLIIATAGLDELLHCWERSTRTLVLLGLPIVIVELFFHFYYWRIEYMEESSQVMIKPLLLLAPCLDQTYTTVVYTSWGISFVSFILVIFLLRNPSVKHEAHAIGA
jgi:hypothetical protein